MSEAVSGIKSEIDQRVDALTDVAKTAGESVAETPGELTQQLANILTGGGEVAGKSWGDFMDFINKKIKDLTKLTESGTQVVTGK